MESKRAIFSLLLVLALTQGIHCGLSHRVLERLALPQLGQHTHNAASSAASAASTTYGSFRTYLTNLYPQLALQPSLVDRISGASSSSSSSASSSGGIRPIVEPIVSYASPAVALPGIVGSELVSPAVISPGVYPSQLDSTLVAAAPLVTGDVVDPVNFVAY